MKYLKIKLKKKLNIFFRYEFYRFRLKFLFYNTFLPYSLRQYAYSSLIKLPLNSSFVRIRNQCVFTPSSYAVLRYFKVSRIYFKHLVSEGRIVGIRKSS